VLLIKEGAMLGSISTYFFEKEKQKRLQHAPVLPKSFHLNRKNQYGLLLDATEPDDRNIVIAFAEQLRREGNRVRVLGYVDGKKEGLSISFDVFTSAELTTISKIPKSSLAESFMDQPLDILINMAVRQNHKPLEYIAAVSKASFRVGPWYGGSQNNPYDLCVDAGTNATLKEWIDELMHTLRKIY
jgi:hypothetical protein